jgi:hypothetical protein
VLGGDRRLWAARTPTTTCRTRLVQHQVTNPSAFWSDAQQEMANIPSHLKLHHTFPTPDGSRAVCVWEAASVEAIRSFLKPAVGGNGRNEYYEVANTSWPPGRSAFDSPRPIAIIEFARALPSAVDFWSAISRQAPPAGLTMASPAPGRAFQVCSGRGFGRCRSTPEMNAQCRSARSASCSERGAAVLAMLERGDRRQAGDPPQPQAAEHG